MPQSPTVPPASFGRALALALLAWIALAASGFAQAPLPTDPARNARIRFGPFFLQPTLSITDAGIDTNVFNSSDQPERDFTITIVPGVADRLRGGAGAVDRRRPNGVRLVSATQRANAR